jgi:hypothetical protein
MKARTVLVAAVAMAATFGGVITADPGVAAVPHQSDDRVVFRGEATLDSAPFDAPYMGAVVVRRGLVTPCQHALPPVEAGRYEIGVYAKSEAAGCGALGAEVFLWTFAQEQIVYSSESVPWPGNGSTTTFLPTFSIASPDGGVGPTVGFAGEVFDRRGRRQPPGVVVEAYVGTTRCGVASTRRSGNFTGFSIDVVGPDAIPGCTLGATITFRLDGRRTRQLAVNESGHETTLDLSLR